MKDFLLLWGIAIFIFSGGIWYIKEGYYYGFIKQKYKKSSFLVGDKDEDYHYGDKAKKMGAFQIFTGVIFIFASLVFLLDNYFNILG